MRTAPFARRPHRRVSEIPGCAPPCFRSLSRTITSSPQRPDSCRGARAFGINRAKGSGKALIRVDDQILHWDEGKVILFDDSYEHEVRNDTELRAVLFLDIDRPMDKQVRR